MNAARQGPWCPKDYLNDDTAEMSSARDGLATHSPMRLDFRKPE